MTLRNAKSLNVLHPKNETEIISPLSRKGAASGEFERIEATRVGVLASSGGQGEGRRASGGSGGGFGGGPTGSGAMAGEAGSGDAAIRPAAGAGAGGRSGGV